jgi:hypothetical protein
LIIATTQFSGKYVLQPATFAAAREAAADKPRAQKWSAGSA